MTERPPELDALIQHVTEHIERHPLTEVRSAQPPTGFDLDALRTAMADIEEVAEREQRAQHVAIKVICRPEDADRISASYDLVLAEHLRNPMAALVAPPRPIEILTSELIAEGTAITYDPMHYGGREYPWSET